MATTGRCMLDRKLIIFLLAFTVVWIGIYFLGPSTSSIHYRIASFVTLSNLTSFVNNGTGSRTATQTKGTSIVTTSKKNSNNVKKEESSLGGGGSGSSGMRRLGIKMPGIQGGGKTKAMVKDVPTASHADHKPKELCPLNPPISDWHVPLNLTEMTYDQLEREFKGVLQPGGHYAPSACKARERLALIIPYRDRQRNLHILLHNLIPFLIRQQAEFSIFLVEQVPEYMFNKGILIDVGFLKAQKQGTFTCFIVHDTDLIPEDYRNLYRCHDSRPRHLMLIRRNDHFIEKLPYHAFIGGAIALREEHFVKSNGWSTAYYGWGFEDDDMEIRLKNNGLPVVRYNPMDIGTYHKLDHPRQKPGPRDKLAGTVRARMRQEGLNSVNYTLVQEKTLALYTWILLRPPPPPLDIYGITEEIND